MAVSKKKILLFQKKVMGWYEKNKRKLPWRKTRDPYQILISEVMLQQTQVGRVVPYFLKFVGKYPSLRSLAKAKKKTLLKLWSGLGYNSRALRLKKLASAVVESHRGRLPAENEKLLELPGIGKYTANAVLAFAFNREAPVIDTNIRRVLIHELHLRKDISLKGLSSIALQCIPKGKSRIWHNALMDYGALEMTAKKTGIKPLSKQGKFIGSERWVRGQIVKMLLKKPRLRIGSLKKKFPDHAIPSILKKMADEGMVSIKRRDVSLL